MKKTYTHIGPIAIEAFLEKRAALIAEAGESYVCLSVAQLQKKITRCAYCREVFLRPTECGHSTYCSKKCTGAAKRQPGRDAEILGLYKQGLSYRKIGEKFKITGYRVGQIVWTRLRELREQDTKIIQGQT